MTPQPDPETAAVASGFTSSLRQSLLAADGQIGKTVLAVAYASHQGSEGPSADTKAQIASLGEGNVVFVYASGSDFAAGTIQEGPIFLGLGETYVIENVTAGAIITATEGAYGFSQQRNGNDESPMPLLSLGLAFTDTFLYAFRNSQTYDPGTASTNQGWIHVVCGPVAGLLKLTDGAGAVVQGQQDIEMDAWSYTRLFTDGNQEYRITATQPVMAAINGNMSTTGPRFYDSRLVTPLTNDGITWPRSGFASAPYPGTRVRWWVNDGAAWDDTGAAALDLNPGVPVDIDAAAATGASDQDYEPAGATRFKADGLFAAYSGADSAGLEASPLCPSSNFTQRIALPLHIRQSGDGGNNGIALASCFEGAARVYEWNAATGQADLVMFTPPGGGPAVPDILLVRRSGEVEDLNGQNHPASALVSNGSDPNSYAFTTDFKGGYVEATVPCTCVFNSEQNENGTTTQTFRGTSGVAVAGIHSDDDEQLTFGITPPEIRANVSLGADRLLYISRVGGGGLEVDLA